MSLTQITAMYSFPPTQQLCTILSKLDMKFVFLRREYVEELQWLSVLLKTEPDTKGIFKPLYPLWNWYHLESGFLLQELMVWKYT